jgi:hypothetical protein
MRLRAVLAAVSLGAYGCREPHRTTPESSGVERCATSTSFGLTPQWPYPTSENLDRAYSKVFTGQGVDGLVVARTEFSHGPSWIGHVAPDGSIVDDQQILDGDDAVVVLHGLGVAADGSIAIVKQSTTALRLEEFDATGAFVWSRQIGNLAPYDVAMLVAMLGSEGWLVADSGRVRRFDRLGDEVWSVDSETPGFQQGTIRRIQPAPDGGAYVALEVNIGVAEAIARISDRGDVILTDLLSLPRFIEGEEGVVAIESGTEGKTRLTALLAGGEGSAIFECVGDVSVAAGFGRNLVLAGLVDPALPASIWVRVIQRDGATVGALTIPTATGAYSRTRCRPSGLGEADNTIQLLESCHTFYSASAVILPAVIGMIAP